MSFLIILMRAFMFIAVIMTIMVAVRAAVGRVAGETPTFRGLSLLCFFSLLASIFWSYAAVLGALAGHPGSQVLIIYAGPLLFYAWHLHECLKKMPRPGQVSVEM